MNSKNLRENGRLQFWCKRRLFQSLNNSFHVETCAGVDGSLLEVIQLVHVSQSEHFRCHRVGHAEGHRALGGGDERVDLEAVDEWKQSLGRCTFTRKTGEKERGHTKLTGRRIDNRGHDTPV